MVKRGMTPQQAAKVWKSKTKLQKVRTEKGLSQGDLAKISGIPKSTIISYEHNTRPIEGARLSVLCDLCIALSCRISDIIEDKETISKYKKVK